IVGQLHRLAVGQEFDIDLSGAEKGIAAADESKHAAIGGERRIHRGIGEECELLPIIRRRSSASSGTTKKKTGQECDQYNCPGRRNITIARSRTLRRR